MTTDQYYRDQELQQNIRELTYQVDYWKQQYDKNMNIIRKLEEFIKELELKLIARVVDISECKNTREQLSAARLGYAKLLSECEALQKQNDYLKLEVELITSDRNAWKKELAKTNSELESVRNDRESAITELSVVTRERDELQLANDFNTSLINQLQQSLSSSHAVAERYVPKRKSYQVPAPGETGDIFYFTYFTSDYPAVLAAVKIANQNSPRITGREIDQKNFKLDRVDGLMSKITATLL